MTRATRSLLAGMLLFVGVATDAAADSNPEARNPQTLTLTAALARALSGNPELAAARATLAANASAARQASSWPNPVLSLEVENFAGDDALRGFDGAETTLRLEQTIELGGKRAQRQAFGKTQHQIATLQHNLTRAELYPRTIEAFMGLLAAQKRLERAESLLQLARQTQESIQAQIEAGKTSAITGTRMQPLLIEARLERDRATGALIVMRQDLAALIGEDDPTLLAAEGELATLPALPESGELTMAADTSAHLALAAATRDQAALELDGERRRAVPDVTLGLGMRRFEASGEQALVAGLSIPLPLFDRNRNGIAAAAARLEAARQMERNSHLQHGTALAAAQQVFTDKYAETLALQQELLPLARQAFEAVDYGYRAGKFGLLDLLATQQQLTEVELRLLTAQVECHTAAARLDALLGRFPLINTDINP